MLAIVAQMNPVHPLMYAGFVVTAVSCAMILRREDRRRLHDLIGGTEVRLVPRFADAGGAGAVDEVSRE